MAKKSGNAEDIHRTHAASMTGAGEGTRPIGVWQDEET
jgi:hypothetical protein